MKKLLIKKNLRKISSLMVLLIAFSTFSIYSPKVEAEVITLPAGAWHIAGRTEDTETILHSIDVDSATPGDQQIVYASPGQTISISYTFQMWSSGGPGIIKQALFAYSWASSWPPWDAYTSLYDGASGGYYPGFYKTDTITVTVPLTPGEYNLWFCSEAHYSMNLAMQGFTEPPTMLPHAIIIVEEQTIQEKKLKITGFDLDENFDAIFSFPNGTTFTLRSFLTSKGFEVYNFKEAFPDGVVTIKALQKYDVVLVENTFLDDEENYVYNDMFVEYVKSGGGLLMLGQCDSAETVPKVILDNIFGFNFIPGGYQDAEITDTTHPIMQGITQLPEAGGKFVDWDDLIEESPLPANVSILARTTEPNYYTGKVGEIAMIAFEYGNGRVVAGPWDGLIRPYAPTTVDGWDVISEPVLENKLLLNVIRWLGEATILQQVKQLCVDVSGEHDYLPWENIKVKISALVADAETMEPVSGAYVTIVIYNPQNNLWVNETMSEIPNTGIYTWESQQTARQIFIHHGKGIYTAIVNASYPNAKPASAILTFHIDPFPENNKTNLYIIATIIVIIVTATVVTISIKRKNQKSKPSNQ